MACALPDRERKPEPALNRGALFPSDFVMSTLQIGYGYIPFHRLRGAAGKVNNITFLCLLFSSGTFPESGKSSITFLLLLLSDPQKTSENLRKPAQNT